MSYLKNYLFLYLILISSSTIIKNSTIKFTRKKTDKVLIVTPTSNHPEYIKLQNETFKKYLQDTYQFIIFNDAKDAETQKAIDGMCASLAIKSIHVPQENRPEGTVYSWASCRHGQAMDYILRTVGRQHNGIMAIVDSDMFLIKNFSISNFLKGYDIAGLPRGPKNNESAYMWPGLLFLRMNALPNTTAMSLQPDDSLGFDTGGALYHYLKAYPSIKQLPFKEGRLKLGKNYYALHVYSEPSRGEYLQCSTCVEEIHQNKKPATFECTHQSQLLSELGFRKEIITIIQAGQMPYDCEFMLGDTFFHLSRGSGYHQLPPEVIERNNQCTNNFMNYILKDTTN